MKLLSAQNITHSINDAKLFHNLSFDINSAEALHIRGGNGSGKSTLLRIILGITTPSKGLVEFIKYFYLEKIASYRLQLFYNYIKHKLLLLDFLKSS